MMAEPTQLCLPMQVPEPTHLEPDCIGDAAGDAPECCDVPSPPSSPQPDKAPELVPSDLITGMGSRGVPNLDQGWAWLVMVAALFTHILTFGMLYPTLAAFYVEFLKEFGGSSAATSWTGSILLGVMLCSGPLTSVLIDKFGACTVAMMGGAFASAGFFLSSMATSLLHLYFSFGVLTGLGLGMSYLPCIVMLGKSFERRRAFAAGIAASGSGLGTFIFAPLDQSLLTIFGWRQSFIILGGLELVLCLCGATYLKRKMPVRGVVGDSGRDANGGDGENVTAKCGVSTPSMIIISRPGIETSTQSLSSVRTNGADRGIHPVGSWKQSIGVRMGRVLLQTSADSALPSSPILLDNFFGLSSPVPGNTGVSSVNYPSVGDSESQVLPSSLVPTIEITRASSPSSPVPTTITQSPDVGQCEVGSWQQSVNVRAGLSSFLQSPITSPTIVSPLALDNISRLSVPSTNELSVERSISGSQNNLTSTTNLNSVPEEERLYPRLEDLAEPNEAISVTSIDAGVQEDLQEGDSHQVNEHDAHTPSIQTLLPGKCNRYLSPLVIIGRLFHNRFFVLFCLSGFMLCVGYQLPYMFFKAFALSLNIGEDGWAVIMAIMGITDMLGRLLVGFVFDRAMCVAHRLVGYVGSIIIAGVLLVLVLTASTYPTLALAAGTYTLVAGSTDPLVGALLVEYVGLDSLCYSFGMVIEMQGLGFLLGPPLAGFVYNYVQNYAAIFIVGALAFISSGCILLLEPLMAQIQTWQEKRRQHNVESSDTAQVPELAACEITH